MQEKFNAVLLPGGKGGLEKEETAELALWESKEAVA